ncbi:unnamed protein product, partial [Trichogramma brassicae]
MSAAITAHGRSTIYGGPSIPVVRFVESYTACRFHMPSRKLSRLCPNTWPVVLTGATRSYVFSSPRWPAVTSLWASSNTRCGCSAGTANRQPSIPILQSGPAICPHGTCK